MAFVRTFATAAYRVDASMIGSRAVYMRVLETIEEDSSPWPPLSSAWASSFRSFRLGRHVGFENESFCRR